MTAQLALGIAAPALRVVIDDPRCRLYAGDAAALRLAPASVHAIVADPPAGIDFMGNGWDGDKGGRDAWIAWLVEAMRPSFQALKPGGHALVWALPRTSHWTATALENLGFEIRDIHHHLFGTGFPKSLDVEKAGAGEAWAGWGTALKPACEHWILCRKPLDGTVARNVRWHGVGGLNIDGCRIEGGRRPAIDARANVITGDGRFGSMAGSRAIGETTQGRWPAHVSFDEEAAAALDAQAGERRSGSMRAGTPRGENAILGKSGGSAATEADIVASVGGASRFFYVAKPTPAERDEGLDHLAPRSGAAATGSQEGQARLNSPRTGAGRGGDRRNFHPTVKSVALMRWLVRLITPPGGLVLDPFAGSGSTGVAALAEGMQFIGVEQGGEDGEYLPIIEGRLRHALAKAATP